MEPLVTGIHHVTAFAGEVRAHVRFYTQALGLDLVKRTVNFDDPSMWHLYYGGAHGAPGTLLTHFPQQDAARARHGGREIAGATIATMPGGLAALSERLRAHGVAPRERGSFGAPGIEFEDPDGMQLRAEESTRRQTDAPIEVARVTLVVPDAAATELFLQEVLGFELFGREHATTRLALAGGGSGREVDVVHAPGLHAEAMGAGTIHHVAWRVPDDDAQLRARSTLQRAGVAVTEVRDRQYFRSIYFRIPGGVLFEVATDVPGFAVDEPRDALGRALRLPPQFEPLRTRITTLLPDLE